MRAPDVSVHHCLAFFAALALGHLSEIDPEGRDLFAWWHPKVVEGLREACAAALVEDLQRDLALDRHLTDEPQMTSDGPWVALVVAGRTKTGCSRVSGCRSRALTSDDGERAVAQLG